MERFPCILHTYFLENNKAIGVSKDDDFLKRKIIIFTEHIRMAQLLETNKAILTIGNHPMGTNKGRFSIIFTTRVFHVLMTKCDMGGGGVQIRFLE